MRRRSAARASHEGLPWAFQTTAGLKCVFDSDMPPLIHGKRANYACKHSKNALWGKPNRKTEPWTIYVAPATATNLTNKAKIKAAWF